MKQPKRLTLRQKELLTKNGYDNADRYMSCGEENGELILWNKETKEKEKFVHKK